MGVVGTPTCQLSRFAFCMASEKERTKLAHAAVWYLLIDVRSVLRLFLNGTQRCLVYVQDDPKGKPKNVTHVRHVVSLITI